MIARAFASLPERWQAVLWHTEIEGARPADVAPLLGLTANSVAALAYRAREGLRQAMERDDRVFLLGEDIGVIGVEFDGALIGCQRCIMLSLIEACETELGVAARAHLGLAHADAPERRIDVERVCRNAIAHPT